MFGPCEGAADNGNLAPVPALPAPWRVRPVWGSPTGKPTQDNRAAKEGTHGWQGLQALRDRIITRTTTAFVLDPDGNNVEAVCHAPA
jgi:hypothetical protein